MASGYIKKLRVLLDVNDNASASVKQVKRQSREMETTFDDAYMASKKLGTALKVVGTAAGAGAISIGLLTMQGARLDKIFATIRATATATKEQMQTIRQEVRAIGAQTPVSLRQAAEAFRELSYAGFSAEESIASARDVVELAVAGNIQMGRAAKTTAQNLNAFSLRADQAGQVSNTLAAVFSTSATRVEGLAQGMTYLNTTASQLNQTFTQSVSALGVLADAGIEGSRAGTALNQALGKLVSGAGDTQQALKAVGLTMKDFKDADGNFLPLVDIVGKLQQRLKAMGIEGAGRQKFLNDLVGRRGARAFGKLIQNVEGLQQKIQQTKFAQIEAAIENLNALGEEGRQELSYELFATVDAKNPQKAAEKARKQAEDMTEQQLQDSMQNLDFSLGSDAGLQELVTQMRKRFGTGQQAQMTIQTRLAQGLGMERGTAKFFAERIADSSASLQELKTQFENVTTAQDIYEAQLDSVGGKLRYLRGSFTSIAQQMYRGFEPALDIILNGLMDFADVLNQHPMLLQAMGASLFGLTAALTAGTVALAGMYAKSLLVLESTGQLSSYFGDLKAAAGLMRGEVDDVKRTLISTSAAADDVARASDDATESIAGLAGVSDDLSGRVARSSDEAAESAAGLAGVSDDLAARLGLTSRRSGDAADSVDELTGVSDDAAAALTRSSSSADETAEAFAGVAGISDEAAGALSRSSSGADDAAESISLLAASQMKLRGMGKRTKRLGKRVANLGPSWSRVGQSAKSAGMMGNTALLMLGDATYDALAGMRNFRGKSRAAAKTLTTKFVAAGDKAIMMLGSIIPMAVNAASSLYGAFGTLSAMGVSGIWASISSAAMGAAGSLGAVLGAVNPLVWAIGAVVAIGIAWQQRLFGMREELSGLLYAVDNATKGLQSFGSDAIGYAMWMLDGLMQTAKDTGAISFFTGLMYGAADVVGFFGDTLGGTIHFLSRAFHWLGRITNILGEGAWNVVTGKWGRLNDTIQETLNLLNNIPGVNIQMPTPEGQGDQAAKRGRKAGRGMSKEFAKGAKDNKGQVEKATKDVVGASAAFLPSSNADRGPLSNLQTRGEAMMGTFASGMRRGEYRPAGKAERLAQRLAKVLGMDDVAKRGEKAIDQFTGGLSSVDDVLGGLDTTAEDVNERIDQLLEFFETLGNFRLTIPGISIPLAWLDSTFDGILGLGGDIYSWFTTKLAKLNLDLSGVIGPLKEVANWLGTIVTKSDKANSNLKKVESEEAQEANKNKNKGENPSNIDERRKKAAQRRNKGNAQISKEAIQWLRNNLSPAATRRLKQNHNVPFDEKLPRDVLADEVRARRQKNNWQGPKPKQSDDSDDSDSQKSRGGAGSLGANLAGALANMGFPQKAVPSAAKTLGRRGQPTPFSPVLTRPAATQAAAAAGGAATATAGGPGGGGGGPQGAKTTTPFVPGRNTSQQPRQTAKTEKPGASAGGQPYGSTPTAVRVGRLPSFVPSHQPGGQNVTVNNNTTVNQTVDGGEEAAQGAREGAQQGAQDATQRLSDKLKNENRSGGGTGTTGSNTGQNGDNSTGGQQ